MHPERPLPYQHASLLRFASVGLLCAATALSLHAQAAADQPATTTTTTTTTATTTPSTTAEPKKDSDVTVLSEFTVEGSYAGSLEMAAEEKQNAPGIIEAI